MKIESNDRLIVTLANGEVREIGGFHFVGFGGYTENIPVNEVVSIGKKQD